MKHAITAVFAVLLATMLGGHTAPADAAGELTLAIDCDIAAPGVQSTCDIPRMLMAGTRDVGVVLTNTTDAPTSVGSVTFTVFDPDTTRLNPPHIDNPGTHNDNPDFNEAGLPNLASGPVEPDNDLSQIPGQANSFLDYFTGSGNGPALPVGASILLATVRYNIPPGAPGGSVPLSLEDASIFDNLLNETGSCNPPVAVAMTCVGATVRITPFALMADCNPALSGVQSTCYVPNHLASREVIFSLQNVSGASFAVHDFELLELRSSDTTRLNPPDVPSPPPYWESNPNFNDFLNNGMITSWSCSNPTPDNDTGTGPPGSAVSAIGCFVVSGPTGSNIPHNTFIELARVRYDIPAGADPGTVEISSSSIVAKDASGVEAGSCAPVIVNAMACPKATIILYCAIDQADVSNNATVNAQDLGQVAQRFGQLPAPQQYEQDFNGVINAADLGLVASQFSKTVAMCP
jgi:hypothetical protein